MKLYGFDSETWAFWDGNGAPPVVCISVAHGTVERLLDRTKGLRWLKAALKDPKVHLVAHNAAFDIGAACAADPILLELFWAAIEAGRIHDTGIREGLLDIAFGTLGTDPKTGKDLKAGEDDGGVSYSLSLLVDRYFGVDLSAEKKDPNSRRVPSDPSRARVMTAAQIAANRKKYHALQNRIAKLRAEEYRLMERRVKAEVDAKHLLPKCKECGGSGRVYYGHDEYTGTGHFGNCTTCKGYGRVGFPE